MKTTDDTTSVPDTTAKLHLERTIKNVGKVEANGAQTAEGFVVLKGSHISLTDDDTIPAVIKEHRKNAQVEPIKFRGVFAERLNGAAAVGGTK